jgi:hypothetical protein
LQSLDLLLDIKDLSDEVLPQTHVLVDRRPRYLRKSILNFRVSSSAFDSRSITRSSRRCANADASTNAASLMSNKLLFCSACSRNRLSSVSIQHEPTLIEARYQSNHHEMPMSQRTTAKETARLITERIKSASFDFMEEAQ